MNANALVEQLLTDRSALERLPQLLDDDVATVVVERLKQEADRHWWINANRSLELAELIVRIGRARGDARQTALGMMARGDALKYLEHMDQAWEALEQAGLLFREVGDQIGWARTRIGRLPLSLDLNCVAEALADAERARAIFIAHQEREKCLRLDLNTALVYNVLGDQRQALALYRSALEIAESLGPDGQDWLGVLHTNMGNVYHLLGDFRQATAYHERARALFLERRETRGLALAELNIAHIAMAQGHYRRALRLLHQARERYDAEQLALDATHVNLYIVECYLLLNRYVEARDLARQIIDAYRAFGTTYEESLALLHQATAEAELGELTAAQAALDAAEPIFASLGASTWVATTRLRRGRVALSQNDLDIALREAAAAAVGFAADRQLVSYAMATLLRGQARFASGELAAALRDGTTALRTARRSNVPALRYTAHLLLGRIAEAGGRWPQAARRYRAAAATVDRVQRELTITLRPGFLEDKDEALRALIGIYLRDGSAERAFDTIERAKSQVLLNYLANREQLRWAGDDPRSRALIDELDGLREEHQWLYRLAHEQLPGRDEAPRAITPQQALIEIAARERRMRAITEQLYLQSGERSVARRVSSPRLREVQRHLDAETLLIAFYNDGVDVWAFTLDSATLEAHRLPIAVGELGRLLEQLQRNCSFALNAGPEAPTAHSLTALAQRILGRLYAGLLEPLAARLRDHRRLTIVPYGVLHYLPFHLLHSGSAYLIEQYEVAILPAAGLITRGRLARPAGALALAHSWDGRLPQTTAEAELVRRLFGGAVYAEQTARRAILQRPPAQILHIAAHGEHRLDQPDLSYVQLADGQLYTDDLLQLDLSYELVTLSACETGRANVAGGDELVGLGRGFLYAGAGALLATLWRVHDDMALRQTEHIYRALREGATKTAALRGAQRAILAEAAHLHPAFWGAFQLIGDASPLST